MSNRPKFGYLVPTRDAVMRAPDGRADIGRMIDLAVLSERMGFDSIWIGDSILARPRFEALTTLAAIAARTSRAQLGTAVYLTPLRHPLPLAHTVGNLDLLSEGRLLFGIGLGREKPPQRHQALELALQRKSVRSQPHPARVVDTTRWQNRRTLCHNSHPSKNRQGLPYGPLGH